MNIRYPSLEFYETSNIYSLHIDLQRSQRSPSFSFRRFQNNHLATLCRYTNQTSGMQWRTPYMRQQSTNKQEIENRT